MSSLPLEGYATEPSVVQGDTLELHFRSEHPTYQLVVLQQQLSLVEIAQFGSYEGHAWSIPDSAWYGCDWPTTQRIPIPESWSPGAYLARATAGVDSTRLPFVVRARVPGSHGSILVQLSTNTWQAYNRYGGKSLYGAYRPGLVSRAHRVSFLRPQEGTEFQTYWEYPFISYLEREHFDYEVCTNYDLHRDPHLLEAYRVFVSVGHDEYYSKEMFDALERFADTGGALAFFSANTLWWQVRFEDNGHTLVCFKNSSLDPLLGVDDSRVTVNWHSWPVLRPPARLMGGYFSDSWGITEAPYVVQDPHHWVFAGTSVSVGQAFGYPMVGFEADARTADSPANVQVIARADVPDLNSGGVLRPAEMVFHERPGGGVVFAGGTVNYTQGLVQYYNRSTETFGTLDPVAIAVTNNVLRRFSAEQESNALPSEFSLSIRTATIDTGFRLWLTASEPARAALYDVAGRRVNLLSLLSSGMSSFDLRNTPSGIYFLCVRLDGRPDVTYKVPLVK